MVDIIGISCARHVVLRGDREQPIAGLFHLLPSLVCIVKRHIPVVGTTLHAGLRLKVIAGFSLIKIQVIIAMVIVVVAFAFLISLLYILQIFLPFIYIRCGFRTGNVDFWIIIGFVHSIIPKATGRTIVWLRRMVRTGKRRIACPVSILAVQISRTVRNQNQVLSARRHICVFLQSFLTGKETGMDIRSSGVFGFHGFLYFSIFS